MLAPLLRRGGSLDLGQGGRVEFVALGELALEAPTLALQLFTIAVGLELGGTACGQGHQRGHGQADGEQAVLCGDQVGDAHANTSRARRNSSSRSFWPFRPPLILRVMRVNWP